MGKDIIKPMAVYKSEGEARNAGKSAKQVENFKSLVELNLAIRNLKKQNANVNKVAIINIYRSFFGLAPYEQVQSSTGSTVKIGELSIGEHLVQVKSKEIDHFGEAEKYIERLKSKSQEPVVEEGEKVAVTPEAIEGIAAEIGKEKPSTQDANEPNLEKSYSNRIVVPPTTIKRLEEAILLKHLLRSDEAIKQLLTPEQA